MLNIAISFGRLRTVGLPVGRPEASVVIVPPAYSTTPPTLPEGALRLLTIAQSNSARLVRLINDILDIEKIESGQLVFNFKRVDVRAL